MEAHPRSLTRVFHADLRLVVPLFQRPYVWRAEAQWLPLWQDVLSTRDRMANGDQIPHFLGAVVLEARSTAHGGLEVREVIDGQQRLTTLQLLVTAIRDSFTSRGLQDHRAAKRLTRLISNDNDLVEGDDERFRLWPTNADRAGYRAVMTGQHKATFYTEKLKGIVGAYTWFKAEVDALLVDLPDENAADELASLAEVLLENFEVVVIDLGKDDNAQVIFETLNARGTPLRASDLIKNLIFRTLQTAGRRVEELYERYWMPLETEAWQVEVRQGRLNRPRLDAFMGYFLTIRLQREVQAHQLFPSVRKYIGENGGNPNRAEELLRELARYAKVYSAVESLQSDNALERARLHRLQIVDTTTLTPLLLWLFANTEEAERAQAVQALESYVVRRTLARLTTKNYNRLFLELLRRLGAGDEPAGQVTSTYLAEQGSDSGMWPTDEEISNSLATLPLYRLLKRERLQRVLLALELHAQSAKTEPLAAARKLSVEHLLPQQWEEHWDLPADPADAELERQARFALMHTIGNLTLVTNSLNSTMSNASWQVKRRHLLEHSALTLNRSLPEQWDATAIAARSQYLASLAVALWERPRPSETYPLLASPAERDLRPDRDGHQPASTTGTAVGQAARRRDIGKHIEHVFRDLAPGEFLKVREIAERPSSEYPDKAPSQGAISARLFGTGDTATKMPSVVPEVRDGVRGAYRASLSES